MTTAHRVREVEAERHRRRAARLRCGVERAYVRRDRTHLEHLPGEVVDAAEEDEGEAVVLARDGGKDVLGVQQRVRTRRHLDELGRRVQSMVAQLRHDGDAVGAEG